MIDHCGVSATSDNFDAVVAFYIAALAPLGYKKMFEYPGHAVGLGDTKADFWIGKVSSDDDDDGKKKRGVQHIAFVAKDEAAVDEFHKVGIGAGATDNGQPGKRFGFPKEYYASFIIDPLGNNIEAACRPAE